MKRWAFILLFILLLGFVAGCRGNTGEPVSGQVADISGKAVQVKDGQYHPLTADPDSASQNVGAKTMELSFSPDMNYLLQSVDSGISLYKNAFQEAPKIIWNDTDPDYWGSSDIHWSSNGQKFIFTGTSYPNDRIYNRIYTVWLVDLQNQATQKILERSSISYKQWSPDDRYILIEYGDETIKYPNDGLAHMEASALSIYDSKTAKSRLLFSGNDNPLLSKPLWSPDSQHLVYAANGDNKDFILALYDIQEGESEQITTTKTPYYPQAWSRDGKSIFYETGPLEWGDLSNNQLGVYDLNTREDHRLTTENRNGPKNSFLSISPDEKTLLYLNGGKLASEHELWQMNIATETNQKVQTGFSISNVLWTADSRNYIYSAWESSSYNGRGSIWQANINQPKPKELRKGSLQLQRVHKGKLYFIEAVPAGLLKEYKIQVLDLSSGRLSTIIRLPEFTSPRDKVTPIQDFGFILRYGIGARNELNTLTGTFTKDLIMAGNTTTKLKLSNNEMQEIYAEMLALNIVDYPNFFREKSNQEVTPYLTYDLTIHYKGTSKQIYWDDRSLSKTPQAIQLRALFNKIIKMVESKPAYKKMPAAEGAYL